MSFDHLCIIEVRLLICKAGQDNCKFFGSCTITPGPKIGNPGLVYDKRLRSVSPQSALRYKSIYD